MLRLTLLIDVQYLQKIVFCFEKGSNNQNRSSLGYHHPVKKSSLQNLRFHLPLDPTHWEEFPSRTPYHYLETSDLLGTFPQRS